MYDRFTNALTMLKARVAGDRGFTLIELLVVVIIVGILAAIAIPIYLGVQSTSKDASVQTDVANAKIAVVAYMIDNSALPTAITPALLSKYGFTRGTNTNSVAWSPSAPAATATKFCIVGTGVTGTKYYVTESLGSTRTKPVAC